MTPRFLNFIPFVLKWEGSTFEDDPDDKGGATKFGIDQRSHPEVNIRTLTKDDALGIYWTDYWLKVRADELPPKVGEVMMDIAVNNGRGRAIKWAQQLSGVADDGSLGPKTLAAITVKGEALAGDLISRREAFYRDIARGRMQKFLKGWLNRNHDLKATLGA